MSRAALAAVLAVSCPLGLCACGDTIQSKPVSNNVLEGLIAAPYPVYWLGGSFQRLSVSEAQRDPSGAYSVQYGTCVEGGQDSCVPALRLVTSPDNSFVPGGETRSAVLTVRGIPAVSAQEGRTILLATGGVVVDIYADSATLARAAAAAMVPINELAAPGSPLPARIGDTGYGETPLPSQVPSPIAPLRG